MQTRDLYRSPQWKMVASVAALGGIGIGGLVLADTEGPENPPAITLTDPQAITTAPQTTVTTSLGFGPLSDFDSPLDINDTEDSLAESTASAAEPESDTADQSPAG